MAHPAAPAATADGGRLVGLDGLRGVAALVILVHHTVPGALLERGYLAVDFFFMLSGFVIAGAFEPRFGAGLSPARFMARRLCRFYPVVAAGMLACAACAWWAGMPNREILGLLAPQLLMLPRLSPYSTGLPGAYPLNGVQWSIAFELVANLLHATLLWRMSERRLAAVVLAAFLWASVAAAQAGTLAMGDRPETLLGAIPRTLFDYGLGILLFRLHHRGRLPRWRLSFEAGVMVLVAIPILLGVAGRFGNTGWAEPLVAALAFAPLLAAAPKWRLRDEQARFAHRLGALSFPLYAIHVPAMIAIQMLGERVAIGPSVVAFALTWGLSFAAAAALARAVEPRRKRLSQGGAPAPRPIHIGSATIA